MVKRKHEMLRSVWTRQEFDSCEKRVIFFFFDLGCKVYWSTFNSTKGRWIMENIILFACVCICMWCVYENACLCGVCRCLLVHVCAPVCSSWSWHWTPSSTTLYFIHQDRVPGWAWNLPIPTTLASQLAQGIPVSCPPAEIPTMSAWLLCGFKRPEP